MSDKTFTFDTVACLVAALLESGQTLGTRHFEAMAKLDGERSASSFEHQFRPVKVRAKQLSGQPGTAKATPRARGKKGAAAADDNDEGAAEQTAKAEKAKKPGKSMLQVLREDTC